MVKLQRIECCRRLGLLEQETSVLVVVCRSADAEVYPNFMGAIIVDDNKIIISACAGIHAWVADAKGWLAFKNV